jgi:hypothetical protein
LRLFSLYSVVFMLNPEPLTLNPAHYPLSPIHYPQFLTSKVVGAFAGLFVSAALMFACRRLSGALVSPLSPVLLIPSGLLAGASALGIRSIWQRPADRIASTYGKPVLDILLGASLLIFAAALSLPGTNAWGLGFFWFFIAAEEIWAWRPRASAWLQNSWNKKGAIRHIRLDSAMPAMPRVEPAETSPAAVAALLKSPDRHAKDVTQQLIRSMSADGSEVLSGWLRLDFAPHQRIGNLHVAFCPPFAGMPELTVSQIDGPGARIKIAQLLPYGARLDLKLVAFSEESASVLVQFSARALGK